MSVYIYINIFIGVCDFSGLNVYKQHITGKSPRAKYSFGIFSLVICKVQVSPPLLLRKVLHATQVNRNDNTSIFPVGSSDL